MELPEAVKNLIDQRIAYLSRMIEYWDERAESASFHWYLLETQLERRDGFIVENEVRYLTERRKELFEAASLRSSQASDELKELGAFLLRHYKGEI